MLDLNSDLLRGSLALILVHALSFSMIAAATVNDNNNFLLGVQQTGRFRFFVNIEALP